MLSFQLVTPILAGDTASCRVKGNFEHGFIKIKVNNAYRTVHPDDHPGIPADHRNVLGVPPGASFDLWTDPPWSPGDRLEFEIYSSMSGATVPPSQVTIVV
ncbi:MAG TPA: hypothetical protein VG937_07980 [Polyangiaceae bacterium]|nr:hypothetical protein [Polyangiaceae bacterium]